MRAARLQTRTENAILEMVVEVQPPSDLKWSVPVSVLRKPYGQAGVAMRSQKKHWKCRYGMFGTRVAGMHYDLA